MTARERAEKALAALSLPGWVDHVLVRDMFDADGEPALEVVLAIRDDRIDVIHDGKRLNDTAHRVHVAVREAGIDLWPFTRYLSVSDLAAA